MNFLINARVESVSTRDVSVGTSHKRSQKKMFCGWPAHWVAYQPRLEWNIWTKYKTRIL